MNTLHWAWNISGVSKDGIVMEQYRDGPPHKCVGPSLSFLAYKAAGEVAAVKWIGGVLNASFPAS